MTDYQPIDCRTYGEFERAIVGRKRLKVCWRDENGLDHLEILQPGDLETCQGEEFLHAKNQQGQALRLRLDRIVKASVLPASDGK